MELKIDDLKDKHKDKTAVIMVLGPSLGSHIEDLKKLNDNDNLIYFTCNMFDKMIDIKTDYWVVCAPLVSGYIDTAYERYNAQKDATYLFANRIPGFSIESARKHLTINFVPVSDMATDENGLQQNFKHYTNGETYGPVDTVLLHLISVATMTGCKEIYITGADLNYDKGYIKNGIHKSGEWAGKINMNTKAKDRTVNYVKIMADSAKKVGTEIYTLNGSSPLSDVLDVKTIKDLKKSIDDK